jgi:threonine aldolase
VRVDLRSDTVTVPTDGMRRAIAAAEVGDDVYHDDPTVNALEERVADILAMESAMFTPTGTMANQTAIRTHTDHGDIVLAACDAHIDSHELGAANALSGVTVRRLDGDRGTFTADAVREAVPAIPVSMPPALFQPVTLVACENTHNAAGGAVWPKDRLDEVTAVAAELGLATHLDGARLWNAAAASGIGEGAWAAGFDTVSVCFSKGLGAPMGSALAGSRHLIDRARRYKQMFGGGFRQAGMMAAGALYAVEHHRHRLDDDHSNAKRLAAGLAEMPSIEVDASGVETNMVYFRPIAMSPEHLCEEAADHGVLMLPGGDSIRAVTHIGIEATDIDAALAVLGRLVG